MKTSRLCKEIQIWKNGTENPVPPQSQCPNLFEVGNAVGMSSEIDMLPFHTFEPELKPEIICQNSVFFGR